MSGKHRAERPAGYWQAIDAAVAEAPRPTAEGIRKARELLAEYAIRAREDLAVAESRQS
jgi:hypothetical protein